jgi:hypothetical protein
MAGLIQQAMPPQGAPQEAPAEQGMDTGPEGAPQDQAQDGQGQGGDFSPASVRAGMHLPPACRRHTSVWWPRA